MRYLRRTSAFITMLIVLSIAPATSYAANIFDSGDNSVCSSSSSNTKNSALCSGDTNTTNPISGSGGVLDTAINIIAAVAGVSAVFFILMSGYRFLNSGGDSAKIAAARATLIYAIIGLVVIALARVIIGFVIGKVYS
jgi:hypothetical protein